MSNILRLTYNPDVDREIFLNTEDDETLYSLCGANKYTYAICNIHFWYRKFIREFDIDLGPSSEINYKQLYRDLRGLSIKNIMQYGAENGIPDLIEYGIAHGESFKKRGFLLARMAASNGHINVLQYLKDKGVDLTDGYIGGRGSIQTLQDCKVFGEKRCEIKRNGRITFTRSRTRW